MACDYCFVVYNFVQGQSGTPRGVTLPATSFYFRPFQSPFTFGRKAMSPDHVHVTMPIPVASAFSGADGVFLVNSDRHFLILSPTQPLTYEQVLFPSGETHTVVAAAANTHHQIVAGSVIVGLDPSRHDNHFACFVHFMNGAEKDADIPIPDLVYNAPQVIAHFQRINPALLKRIAAPWEKTALDFKGSALTFGQRLKAPMPSHPIKPKAAKRAKTDDPSK
jgi:hypothetical protein